MNINYKNKMIKSKYKQKLMQKWNNKLNKLKMKFKINKM